MTVTALLELNAQIEAAQKERALALEMHARLERIRPDRDVFLAKLKADRASIYKVMRVFNCLKCGFC